MMKLTAGRLTIAAAALVVCAVAANAARADITECTPVEGKFTVYLSGPCESDAVYPDLVAQKAFLSRLQFALQKDKGEWVNAPGLDVQFKVCGGRTPAMDGTDFDAATVASMQHGRVIMEIWGRLAIEPAAGGTTRRYAQMNYFLVPLKFDARASEPAPPALERLEYREERPTTSSDFVELIAHRSDIDAFVAAAFGVKLLSEHSFDLAQRNLCIAEQKLKGQIGDDVESLRRSVVAWAGRAIKEAKADPNYSRTGTLRMFDPADPCSSSQP